MPFKDKEQAKLYKREYMRKCMKTKRNTNKEIGYLDQWRLAIHAVHNEYNEKTILPKHMYNYKPVMRQLLHGFFQKKRIIVGKMTENIAKSHRELN